MDNRTKNRTMHRLKSSALPKRKMSSRLRISRRPLLTNKSPRMKRANIKNRTPTRTIVIPVLRKKALKNVLSSAMMIFRAVPENVPRKINSSPNR